MRVNSHVYNNYFVPPNYNSMIGKIIVYGDTREDGHGPHAHGIV